MSSRREFLRLSVYSGAAALILPGIVTCNSSEGHIPCWLENQKDEYLLNPHPAALEWFKNAKYGMYIHYGLYSLLGRNEWVQFTEKIPVKAYEKLKDDFSASEFDADFITDLILESGMKYLNVVAKHHDSFCLWDTEFSDFKSTSSPARRDLIGELSVQCKQKDIALFLSYSHGRDWRHPHAPNRDTYKSFSTRPAYESPEEYYKYDDQHDLNHYVEFVQNQIGELLSNYGDIAGIHLGGASTVLSGPVDPFHLPELYEKIYRLQSHVLISYAEGVTGTEDITTVLRKFRKSGESTGAAEICDTMQPSAWGYAMEDDGKHKNKEQVFSLLKAAAESQSNLLLNTGPLPDGKIHPEDVSTLKMVGKEIRRNGFPGQGINVKPSRV